ncbi:autotransporter outer membrane beta-barrel domain-containing protein [Castellaniella sp.]|uniref:autotransporter family protein n=1 Tax=Castellaniella sp. TaxID=1955812 RepID=UPI002AFF48BE|nr:autotransporter outer membrane beta-barrel domain-containing protein [Castellaniella sp.]
MRLKDKLLLSASVPAGILLLSGPALSAQLSKTDGGSSSASNGSFSSVSNLPAGSAVFASGGSTITGVNLDITDGGQDSGTPVHAMSGGKIHLSGDTTVSGANGLRAQDAGSEIGMVGGTIDASRHAVYAHGGGQVTLDGVAMVSSGTVSQTVLAYDNGTINLLGGSTLTSSGLGVSAQSGGKIHADGVAINSVGTAVHNLLGYVDLKNFSLDTTGANAYGVNANVGSTTYLENGTITTRGTYASGIWAAGSPSGGAAVVKGDRLAIRTSGQSAHGVYVTASSSGIVASVDLTNTRVETDAAFGLYADHGGRISLTQGAVETKGDKATAIMTSIQRSSIALDGVDVKTLGQSAFGLRTYQGSTISMRNGTIETHGADGYAVVASYGGGITLENVDATTSGAGGRLLVLLGDAGQVNTIDVTGGVLRAADAPAISARGADDTLTLTGTTISGNGTLFDVAEGGSVVNPAFFKMKADASRLTGGARVDAVSRSDVELRNGTLWTLTAAADGSAESAVSNLTVDHSAIAFAGPAAGAFQTLTVGGGNTGGTAQYIANGATLRMNTWLNEGGALSNQRTDRLLINGDVTGTTQVEVNGVAGSPGGATSPDGGNRADEGISLIQVAGNATATSFRLRGDYVALDGMPYQYRLYAYGPGSEHGAADDGQRLVAGTSPYWDYRLQSAFTGEHTREVAPQVPAYIVAPTALFDAGLQDVSNLHSRLGEIRRGAPAGGGADTGEFFLRAYGGRHDYSSNRGAADYGYDADFDYSAAQMGGNLFAFGNDAGIARFGIAGTIGSLSYRPKHVQGAGSGDFDTWSVAAYATWLHAGGGYVDGIVSAGAFDGDVSTSLRGRTASLKGTSLAASLEAGYPVRLGGDFVLEPQAQLVYQRLMFDRQSDVDGFVVDLGGQDQWTGRLGARLSRDFAAGRGGLVTAYAKADVLHGLSSGGRIFLGDAFQLGRYGTSLEGRLGIDAKTSDRLSFHASVAYRHEIGGNGVGGASINGGLRYAF